jgi:hypothetical protein
MVIADHNTPAIYLNNTSFTVQKLFGYVGKLYSTSAYNREKLTKANALYFVNSSVNSYNIRSNNMLLLLPKKSSFGHRKVKFKASMTWNKLLQSPTDSKTCHEFKKNLKAYSTFHSVTSL